MTPDEINEILGLRAENERLREFAEDARQGQEVVQARLEKAVELCQHEIEECQSMQPDPECDMCKTLHEVIAKLRGEE